MTLILADTGVLICIGVVIMCALVGLMFYAILSAWRDDNDQQP